MAKLIRPPDTARVAAFYAYVVFTDRAGINS